MRTATLISAAPTAAPLSTEYAYITVTGGHSSNLSGSASNSAIVQVGVIGTCAQLAADYATINLYVSEASTVAAAYALGNFITINSNTGAGAGAGQEIVNIGAPAKTPLPRRAAQASA